MLFAANNAKDAKSNKLIYFTTLKINLRRLRVSRQIF